ncbi:hypothetical protein ACQJBY_032516 [Aegilops geniculata]
MDTGAAPAPTTVSSDEFRFAYEASTSWHAPSHPGTPLLEAASACGFPFQDGLFGDGELGIHHPQLNPPSYHSLSFVFMVRLRGSR